MLSAQAMLQRWLCHKTSRTDGAGATREQSSDAERDCLAQRKTEGWAQAPASTQGEELNGDHKRCGVMGTKIQAVAEKEGARKRGWPAGQAKAGRKQGEARLQTLK